MFPTNQNFLSANAGLSNGNNPCFPMYLSSAPTSQTIYAPYGVVQVGQIAIVPATGAWICIGLVSSSTGITATWEQMVSSTGDVLSVTGTANQILASPTTGNVVLSLIGPYTPATYTLDGVLYGNGTSSIGATAAGTTGQILTANTGSAPTWTTATYPSTTTINQILFSSAANTVSGLATANNGTLVTSAAGVPSILAGPGTTGQILQSNAAAAPSFSTASYPSTTTINQILYSSAANTVGGLATANNGVLSTGTTGVPAITALSNGQTLIGKGSASAPAATYFSNAQNTYVPTFNSIPVMSLSTGGTAVVTINNTNLWSIPQWGAYFEAYNTVALQAIAPQLSTTVGRGLNIDSATGANAAAMEITEGNSVNSKNAFIIGTSPAFYVKATFNIATLNTIADVFVGFRKQQSYQATVPTGYTDYAVIGAHSTLGEIELQTQVGSGGNTLTDTTNAITAATNFTVQVNVSATGVVTYLLNGSPPATVANYTFTNALTVIPWIYFKSAAGAHGEMDLVSYQCGFQ